MAAMKLAVFALACASLVILAGSFAADLAIDTRVAFVIAYVVVTAEILGLALLAPRLRPAIAGAVCAAALLGIVGLAGVDASPLAAGALTLAIGVGATLAGAMLGGRIEKPGQLVAVGLVSAIADLWSVFDPSAPSATIAERAMAEPERLSPFALPFPILGTPLIPAIIGAGDVLFAALYVAAFRAHQLPLSKVSLALASAFLVGLAGLMITLSPLPLLPLLAAAVLASDPRVRQLDGREWRTVLSVCALMLAVIAYRVAR